MHSFLSSLLSYIGILFVLLLCVLTLTPPPPPPMRFIETIKPWPPELEKPYPDLELIDQNGRAFRLSDYRGKVILLQNIGINNPASQTLAGSSKKGAYLGVPLQEDLNSIYDFFPRYTGGLRLPNKDVVFIQIIFYGISFGHPTQKEAQAWAAHFDMRAEKNQIVAVSPHDLRSGKTYGLIPGFHLIDRNFILRADSSGPKPKDDLFKILLPMVPFAIKAEKR